MPSSTIHRSECSSLNTLSRLRSLHIADIPLHLAPSAHEWLLYLCFTPALEELILEGAILSAADLGARAEERERLDGKTDTATNWREHGTHYRWRNQGFLRPASNTPYTHPQRSPGGCWDTGRCTSPPTAESRSPEQRHRSATRTARMDVALR